MTNNKLQPLVPKLRFPEFVNAPQWQLSTFGERCESFSGGTPDTSKKTYYGGMIPFIRSAEIGCDETEIFLTKEGLENSAAKTVNRGDLLVALYGANSGDTALARIDGAINQAIMCLRSVESVPYLYYYLTSRKKWIITTYLQGGQGNLSGQIVLSVPLSIPHKDEQQKIANCLGSLDDLIAAEGRKLTTLRQQKKGLTQQLFPQPGETVPKLRFPEFRDGSRWVQTPLRDAFKIITNGQANAQDHREDGTYPLFDRSEVVKRSPTFLFDAEAVILPGEGMRFQPRYFSGKFNLHQRVYALMGPKVDPRFAFHSLDRFKGALADSAVKSTVLSLRMPIIEKFTIPCPTSYNEQQKIADCLGSLDDLIVAEGRKLTALRLHKQGLLQQLFPPLDGREL